MIAVITTILLALFFSQPLDSFAQHVPATPNAKTMQFVCTGKPHEAGYKYVEKIYRRAFAKLGYQFSMRHATKEDAINLLRSESVDGDCGRVAHFSELSGLTNTQSIPHAYRMVEFSSWAKADHQLPSSRKDQVIGYNSNALFIPTYLESMGYKKIQGFNNTDSMIQALVDGDIDLLMHYHVGMPKLKESPYAKKVVYHNHILSVPLHGLLLKKHQHLLRDLSDIIARQTTTSPFKATQAPNQPPKTNLKPLKFSCAIPSSNLYFKVVGDTLNQAFNTMGYHITLQSISRGREIAELKNGNMDGSCGRTNFFANNMQEYVTKLDVPLTKNRFQVWSTTPEAEINSIHDFPPQSSLAVVRGTISVNQKVRQYLPIVKQVNSAHTGLQLLAAGEVDFYVDIIQSAGPSLQHLNSQVPIYLSGSIHGAPVYPMLHRKHIYLQKQATELLRKQLESSNEDHLIHY
ncbi:hypothetical protein [Maricurvus nonylphenolicus]|uniref:hypothetical protein n=1 Tax=Maricurvus nonylphenolicus TaxID=1008307 RepID=UPI0036F33303